ncbi:MAG TPA: class I SAM-dependent methyltransferase [Gemmatimonadales bacterium]|nr:class I SAM-dependent methyltransferase [Gemmatimonadales bacterium]
MTLGLPQVWSRVARQYRHRIAPDFLPAARRLCRVVGIGGDDRVLDIACGPGTAAFAALETGGRQVVGVDFAAEMIAWATRDAAGRPARFAEIAVAPVEVPFDADSPEAAWELLRSAAGRVAAAHEELGPGQRARLDHEMIGFFGPFRLPDGRVHWPREALIVTARRS